MRYLSVCSGIEAATVAWHPLGWEPAAFSEIEAFPRAILQHHYPDVPLHGDFTTIEGDEYGPVDLLVGGTPCQSFSVAGLRGGIHDSRGNLALEFLRLLDRTRPRWVVWENVPGVFSATSHDAPDPRPPEIDLDADNGPQDGEEVVVEDRYDADESHAFACFLAGLSELGYGVAWRILDAQYAGVPQRRRRVFVVGYLGDWRRAAAVLFERHSLSGHPAPRREKGSSVAALTANGVGTCGADDNQGQAGHFIPCGLDGGETARALTACHTATGRLDANEQTFIAFAHQQCGNIDLHMAENVGLALQRSQTQAVCFTAKDHGADASDIFPTLRSGGSHASGGVMPAVAFTTEQTPKFSEDGALTLTKQSPTGGGQIQSVMQGSAVRRLTPEECEALQGFPRGYTQVPYRGKPAADGPRYKALGNSMAVPVMAWIGRRIQAVEAICEQREAA